MALPAAPNSLSFNQIRYEFGPRIGPASIGSYRVSQTTVPQGGSLQNLPLDDGVPQAGQIGVGNFFNKRLNVLVNYFSGATSFRNTARADFDSQNIVVVGGLLDPGAATTTSSGRRVIAHVNKSIGSQKSTLNPYICALRTGNGWESNTDLELEIGPSGIIAGAGGDGGDGAFEILGREPVSFVNSFGGAEINSISLSGQVGDLVILVSASSTVFQGDLDPPSGYAEINANKSGVNGDPNLPYYKVSYRTMESSSEVISGLTTSNSIHVASIFRGVQTFSGSLEFASSTTGTTVTFPTVSVDAESLIFVYGIVKDDNVVPVTPLGYTGTFSVDLGTENNVIPGGSLVVGYRLATSAGAISPGSFTSSSWDGDGWISGSIPLGGILLGSSSVNGKSGTSGLGIQYPCAINNAGLIISGGGGGGAGGRGRNRTFSRTQDGCEGFGRYIYAAGGGGGGGRGLPEGTGGTADPYIETSLGIAIGAQNGSNGSLLSGGSGGTGGYSATGGRCSLPAIGGDGGNAGLSGGAGSADNVTPIGSAGGDGVAIVVNVGVPYTPPTGNAPNGSVVDGVTVS